MESMEMLKKAVAALEDKKAIDLKIIDISEISVLADYFVIVSGSNRNQVQALSDNVFDELAKDGIHPTQVEGYSNANWILMDYKDIVIHIFNEDDRLFYDIERIWRDGKEVVLEN